MNVNDIIFITCMFIIAFCYSAVGHGGASGYIALMVLLGFNLPEIKPLVLLLNITVAAISFYKFYHLGYFNFKLLIWFAISSTPLAYIGAKIDINDHYYRLIMGSFLLFSSAFLFDIFNSRKLKITIPFNKYIAIIIGGVIGFISGIIGVGGGIFLSPLVLLLGWANVKETAAVSSLFIIINSVAGFLGLKETTILYNHIIAIGLALAIAGGFAGAKWGAEKSNHQQLKRLLAIVLLVAAFKMIGT